MTNSCLPQRGQDTLPGLVRRFREGPQLVARVRILNRTAVRTGGPRLHRFSRHSLPQRKADKILRPRNVGHIGGGFVINRSVIDDNALRINDDHLRRCLSVIEVPNHTIRIEQRGRRRSLLLREVIVFFAGGHISLLAPGGRKNREPNDSLPGPLLLQPLHVSTVVLLAYEGTSVVVPF